MSNIRRGGGTGGGAPAVPTPTPSAVPQADDDPYNNPEFEPNPVPPVNNGGTLEACETNVFALIELSGLKWRCYMTPTSAPRGVHLSQDDVLRAYGKCLQDGITCTWRRKPPTSLNTGIPEPLQIPSFTNHINKELWVFWYANEPEKLATHCAKLEHVTAEDIGDGSSPPITYEVRILYFKAIHTRIEHCLLKSGMVRLGRWFAKPLPAHYMAKDFTTPRFIEGVSFNFFVHGGNLVCVAVSAERKPALIKLGMRHLESKKRVKVILAPWSLKGEIVPIDEKSDQFLKTQAQQASTLDEFKQFFTFPVPVIEKKKKRRRIIESDDSDCDPSTVKPKKAEIEESGSEESEESSSSGEEYDTTDSDSDFPKSSDGEPETEVESEPESVDREYKPSKKPMPEMVTVEVAGVRFQWPTALVCLTLEHDMEAMNEAGDRNVHSVHISEEARVDDVRKRNELSLDECTTSSFVQGILQTANIPIKRNPAVPPTPVGEFVTPYVAQADDDTKWNNMDPGRTEKCGCTVEHVMKDCHHSDEQIAGWNSKECDEDTSEFFDTIDKCAANHRQHPSNSKPVGYRRKEESIPKPPLMFPKEGTKEKEEADQEIQDEENPTWGRCDNPEEDPIENQTFHDLQRAGEDYIPEAFTPIGAQSPCSGACVMPSVSAEQELPEETFAQIYKPGKQSKVPATAPQKERADDYDYYFNPFMRNEPEFKSYHNRRIGEKRRASYPPPLPLPVPQSPEQPGSQETIPATSSPPPELVLPETTGKLMMSRSVTFPKLKLQEREDEILPRTRKLQRKVYEIESDEENTEEEPREDSDDESPDDGFGEMSGYNSFYPCDDFDEEDVGLPSTFEFEVEKTETDFGEHVSSDEPMETDGAMDNILSPPASNEQYQPLSLKATGPPSVPDANQIYPTPPSVLEANQFSPAGFPMTTMGTTHLHAPPVPSQLVATEEGIKEHEPMEVECMEVVEKHTQKKLAALEVAEHVLPDHTKINGYFSKILQTVISPKNSPQVEKNITTVINRFSLEKKKDNTEELLPIDYYKLAKQLANRPQKPSIEVPISAPHTVGSSSNKINMVPLNHENRSQSDSSKAYQVSFTSIPNPMMQQHPMGFPYHRPGMQVRPGYGPPGGYGAYGATGMPYGGPMGMPNYGPMGQSAMGMPGGYPHMASPLYNPMNAMGSMGGPMNSGPMGHMPMSGGMGHGPMSNPMMGNMGPMSGGPMMNQMNPMGMNAPMNAYQQHQMQQRHMMQMQMQHPQMGPPMNPMGPPMNPWDQPMGMMAPQISSPVVPMAPPLGMGHPMNQQCGVGGPGPFQNQAPPPQPVQPVQQLQEPRPPSPPALPTVGYQMTLGHMDMLPLRYRYLPGPKKVPKTVALNERLAPEASSIVLTIILQDTLLDLHYDICFDACPLCSCNVTIKTRELGLYLIPPEVLRRPAPMQMNLPPYSGFYSSQNQNCNCGFSAVRHRYLSMYNGLFPEDAQEATGVGPKEAITPALGPYHGYDPKSLSIPKYILDSTVNSDRAVMNQLRIMCLKSYVGRTINSLATTAEDMEKAFAPEDDRGIPGSNSEFIMSYVDQTELLLLGNSAVDAALSPLRGPDRKDVSYATFFHPWGLQVANELQVGDEDEALIPSVCEKLKPILDESMKIVRDTNTLEGPLIWRDLSKMRQQVSTKTEELDLSHVVEPVPMVCAVLDRELHHFAPSMLALWEETGLGPVDAPKDILYLAVIPDNAEVHAQTLKYMENLSSQYERLKFGKHIALCYDDVRDGIIRAGGRGRPGTKYHNNTFNFLDIVDKEVQDKTVIARLRLFTQQMEEAVAIVLDKNDCLFNREEFRRQIAQEYRAKKQKLSSTASACEKKMEQEARDRGELVEEEVVIATPPPPSTAPAPAKKSGKKEKEPEPVKDDTPGASTERRSSCLEELLNATPDTSVPPANPAALNATVDPPLEPEEIPQDDYVALPHIICIYVVNPFSWDHESRTAVNARIAMTAIIRTYNAICARIKQQNRTQLMLELIELKEVTDYNGCIANLVDNHRGFGNPKIQTWKNNRDNDQFLDDHSPQDDVLDHCWSIYTAPRIGTPEVVRAVQSRFMTKCGPGYSLFNQINEWQRVMPQMLYNIPSCPYFLVQKPRTELSAGGDKIIYRSPDEYVLFMNYCLVGGDYLVATVTDELGRINQSVVINMKPNLKGHQGNYRFKNHTQIRDAMAKLMVFVHGIITLDIKSVRLVIGRLGKMGHGEFKAWTYLLSKTYLRKLSNKPKDGCKPCHETEGAAGMPNIIAACCISFEAEPYVKVFPKLFDPNDKAVKVRNKITTPGEISATHIMVFTVNTNIDLASREDSGNEHNMDTDDFDMDFGDGLGLGNEFDSIMEDVSNTNIDGSNEAPGRIGSLRSGTIDMSVFDHTSMESIQNQPLATGFYISTAPAKDLPDWFWSSCPQAKRKLPNHFKASLHINNQNIGLDDEDITAVTEKKTEKPKNEQIDSSHPLDSNRTDAVLRYVLETYNQLSWLNIDRVSMDRVSCLPIHVQNLLRLYHAVARVYL